LIDPCGTCRLSKNIEQGVVDAQLKVHGAKRLRVIDASVIPVIPDCRIQNSVYMIGEKVGSSTTILWNEIQSANTKQGVDIIKAAYPELYAPQSAQP
jgi:choline dehydrogenase